MTEPVDDARGELLRDLIKAATDCVSDYPVASGRIVSTEGDGYGALRSLRIAVEALQTARAAPVPRCDAEITELREQLHYLTGTCELAMKHRDAAENALEAILKENCSGPIEVDRWLVLLDRAETAEAQLAALASPPSEAGREKRLSDFTDAEIATEHGWRMQRKLGDPRIGVGTALSHPDHETSIEGVRNRLVNFINANDPFGDVLSAHDIADALRAAPAQSEAGREEIAVPKAALDWLFGAAPDRDGKWFGECEDAELGPIGKFPRRYWWRSKFRRMIGSPNHRGPASSSGHHRAENDAT